MTSDDHSPPPLLDPEVFSRRQEQARSLLATRYAEGALDLESYETRIEVVERAEDLASIDATIADLRPSELAQDPESRRPLVAVPSFGILADEQLREDDRVTAIVGTASRRGAWDLPRRLTVNAVAGEVDLDLRGARIGAGVTEIAVNAFLAEVTVTVPSGLRVAVEGTSTLAEFSDLLGEREVAGDGPLLWVRGTAVLAEVSVRERLRGESGWQALWRRRRERRRSRRELRNAQRPSLPPPRSDVRTRRRCTSATSWSRPLPVSGTASPVQLPLSRYPGGS